MAKHWLDQWSICAKVKWGTRSPIQLFMYIPRGAPFAKPVGADHRREKQTRACPLRWTAASTRARYPCFQYIKRQPRRVLGAANDQRSFHIRNILGFQQLLGQKVLKA